MESEKPSRDDLKSKLKTINAVFYTVLVIWFVFIAIILYRLVVGSETTSLFIGTIPLVAVLIMLSKLKSKLRSEINPES